MPTTQTPLEDSYKENIFPKQENLQRGSKGVNVSDGESETEDVLDMEILDSQSEG